MLWPLMLCLLVSIGIGIYVGSNVHDAKDFISAGRKLPMIVVKSMVFATYFGA
jgi:SSS family solute:Na+ symporter